MQQITYRAAGVLRLLGGAALLAAAAAIPFGCSGAGAESGSETQSPAAHVAGAGDVEAGRYLVRIAGCNDCHTAGYAHSGGNVPVERWLTGNPVGYRGPWGTSYASNLRLYVDPMSEGDWVKVMRERNEKPPMPWNSLHAMNDHDLRAIYRFIKSIGKAGERMPEDVPPGQEPKTPYATLAPPTMPGQGGSR